MNFKNLILIKLMNKKITNLKKILSSNNFKFHKNLIKFMMKYKYKKIINKIHQTNSKIKLVVRTVFLNQQNTK